MHLPLDKAALAVLAWSAFNVNVNAGSPPVVTRRPNAQLAAPGDVFVIPAWDVQSSTIATQDPAALSKPTDGTDSTSPSASWHHAPLSRCTVMGCLLAAGVYNDTDLFFSDHMASIDKAPFQVPWLYRSEFTIDNSSTNTTTTTHYLLETHGITSRADIYINGHQVADNVTQSGAYGGHVYDVTLALQSQSQSQSATGATGLVIRAYPTDYMKDFGLGFVDWNPYPPDNGTGVWRNVVIRRTGPVAIDAFSVVTNFTAPGTASASASTSASTTTGTDGVVTLKAVLRNLGNTTVSCTVDGVVSRDDGSASQHTEAKPATPVRLGPGQTTHVTLTADIAAPAVWWPRQWGDQPLYEARITVSTSSGALSDTAAKSFGFRQVTSVVSRADDILFSVNGRPFQVLGGGYTPDVFLRWDAARFEAHARYTLDMGLNTIRLEGKMEHPELYAIADRLGLMVLPGWECCDKWEAWTYNDDLPAPVAHWSAADYATANASMRHEAAMQQSHPSLLGFLVGSDYWPDDAATAIYLDALADAGWQAPVIASAAKRSYPKALGPGGMKMAGPYDYVPPSYWYDTVPASDDTRYGAAFGFGSEQSPGGGTPALSSLRRFLSAADLDDLWRQPNKSLYHMSTAASSFSTRRLHNDALWKRYGAPVSLDDYLVKTQMADYEAARAMFEAYEVFWGDAGDTTTNSTDGRPATGVIYWMLNGAWPALHWQLFDYYLHPAGAYYGVKAATGGSLASDRSIEHLVYDYVHNSVVLVNRSQRPASSSSSPTSASPSSPPRAVRIELIAADSTVLANTTTALPAARLPRPNTSRTVVDAVPAIARLRDAAFLKLSLLDAAGAVLDRNVYWLAAGPDTLDWDASDWYYTPMAQYANLQSISKVPAANVTLKHRAETSSTTTLTKDHGNSSTTTTLVLENWSAVPAVFVSLNLVDAAGADVAPVTWTDNYVTLFPHERLEVTVEELGPVLGMAGSRGVAIELVGRNVAKAVVTL